MKSLELRAFSGYDASHFRVLHKCTYLYVSNVNGKIVDGIIKNLFTTIRNDDKKIDIVLKFLIKLLLVKNIISIFF